VFFNGYLLHRSLKNRSQIFRRALVSHYMNAWSLLPWSQPKADQNVATHDDRCVFMVHGQDPYAWKGAHDGDQNVWLRSYGKVWQASKHG
jgi:hypothetical protein